MADNIIIVSLPQVALLDKLHYTKRFTIQERVAIANAAKTDTEVQVYLDYLNLLPDNSIDLTDTDLIYFVQMLETKKLIGAGRASIILS